MRDDDIAELVHRCTPHDADVIDLHPIDDPDNGGEDGQGGTVWGAS